MKKLILTLSLGENYKKMGELTHPRIKQYADKIGADFLAITEQKISQTTPHWEKFQIRELLDTYDRILYLDTDILIREDCPDLFDIVPENELGVFNEGKFTDRSKELMIDCCKAYGVQMDWDAEYYNTGVMVISKAHKDLFNRPIKEYCSFYEQTYLNMIISLMKPLGLKTYNLDHKFNRMTCMDKFTGEERFASYLIHYAGYPNIEYVLDLIKHDIEKWKPPYEYKRHILVKVNGGLGDQICAEPAVRFLKEKLYPDDDVTVTTHWKEIFKHIEGIKLFNYDEFNFEEDIPYYQTMTLPEPTSLQWFIISHLMCHSVDYTSMALMKRILPLKDKTPRLKYSEADLNKVTEMVGNFDNLVLIHAGKHWETKTFPSTWWNEVIKGLQEKGKRVCLIGKDSPNDFDVSGTVDVDATNCIDLRNKTSLSELFALIANTPQLITNDSSPVHIAGAFDNEIILIPSCKHPDHILHWRKGNQYYKAKALYKKLPIEEVISHPTQVYETSADFKIDDWSGYLPDSKEIIENI